MGHVVPFERPRAPSLLTETLGYPILGGITFLFFAALWTAAAVEWSERALSAWLGKPPPSPEGSVVPRRTAPVIRLFPR